MQPQSSDPTVERTVDFELDPSAFELGQKNGDGQKHRQNITTNEFAGCIVKGELTAVHYGIHDGRSAALIRFKFTFHCSQWIRYKSAMIKITFASLEKTPGSAPVVSDFFPQRFEGEPVFQTITERGEISLHIGVGCGLAIQPSISRTNVTPRTRRMKIEGDSFHDNSPPGKSKVLWSIYENSANEIGIPHQFSCAAIVHHQHLEFQANVKVTVSTGKGVGLIGHLWRKDDPVYFDCSSSPGLDSLTELVGTDLKELKANNRWPEVVQVPKE
jgi:hypothetical protein